jgi:hypothetical protein
LLVATAAYGDQAFRRLRAPGHDVEVLRRVLAVPGIGGFEVRALVNQPGQLVEEEIEGFFADRKPDDLLVLYLSCHGVKDQDGRLYFAATDTKLQRLAASGISSTFVNEQMANSRSKRVVLLLDCCYSGAFARGFAPRGVRGLSSRSGARVAAGWSSPPPARWSTPSKPVSSPRTAPSRRCSPPPLCTGSRPVRRTATATGGSRWMSCTTLSSTGSARQRPISALGSSPTSRGPCTFPEPQPACPGGAAGPYSGAVAGAGWPHGPPGGERKQRWFDHS